MPAIKYDLGYHEEIGMTIIDYVGPLKPLYRARYSVRCDCGREEVVSYAAISQKYSQKRNKCRSCADKKHKAHNPCSLFPIETIEDRSMRFVEKYWKPTTGEYNNEKNYY